GPPLRLQRERRPHHRAVQPRRLRGARPNPSAEPDLAVRLRRCAARVPRARPSRSERPSGGLGAPRVRQPPHRAAQRRGDHPRVDGRRGLL
ncbi:uncharacterized protein METZ01_LOCUS339331, partial [marine metagenome]